MKKITSILLVVLLVLTCLTMAACDPTNPTAPFDTAGAREKLDLYIFEQEGQVISGEFVLPGTIGGFNATWTSSSEFVVLTEVPADEDNGIERQYTVKVGYPEAVTEVELTVALSSDVKKTFKVIVNPLSVHDFIEAYSFLQDKGTVVADFALDRTVDFAGKAATIAWSVDEAYTDYIEISEDGNTCVVYPTSLNPTVKIKATFTYNGESATKSYRMTVSEVKEHLQAVDYWYANTGVGMEMKGYVVEIATAYAPSYGNISLYIVDEDFCAGYYIYRVKCDQATADRLVPGAPVIVTGTTNTNYNGLVETNAGGTITIDDSREALTELPVHALDEEAVGKLFSANYHQSTLVSLTNWKVKEVKDAPAAGATSTLFIIEKGGVEVSVAVSKYMEGAYLTKADDAIWSALASHGIQVGDIVTVTGILGNYKGHQIMPLSIDGIVKGDTESTVTAGVTASAAVEAIDKALADNGLNAMVAVEKDVALPTVDGATITAKVLGSSRAVTVVDGAIVVAPGKLENACVQIDVTVGEFTTSIFRYIQSADLDDAEKLAMEAAALVFEIEEIKESGKFDLPTASIFSNITVTWSTNNACAVVDGNVLTVKLPTEAVELTLTATLTLGEATPVTVDFKVAVAALSQQYIAKPISEAKVGTFKLAMYQGNLNKTLYFAGDMNGYYYATTEDYVDATDIVVAKSANDGSYTLSFVDAAGATKYLAIKSDGEHTNVLIVDEAADWGWDADIKAFYTMVGTDKTYLGTRNDKNYTTMSAVASKHATTNFIARACTMVTADYTFVAHSEAKVGTFKLAMYQGNLNKTLYFAGDMNGYYYATTEDYVDATDIVIAKSTNDGFYTLSFVDAAGATKYLAIKSDGEHTNVLIVDEAADWGWDADIKAFYTMVGTDKTYLGTRNDKNYTTMSAVASKHATTNFIARTGAQELAETGFITDAEAKVGTFKLAMYQGNLNKTLYFAGDMNGYYYATTEDYVDATDIVIAKSTNDGFYTLSFVDAAGATKYLAIKSDGEHTNVLIVDEAADWGWDADIKAFYTMVGTDKTYLGTRNDKNYTTMSAVASKHATTNFIARTGLWGFVVEEEAEEETPAEKITTIAGALAVESGEAELSGTVAKITYAWNGTTCSFDLTDGTNTINVYKSTTNVTVGDVVTVVGNISVFNNKHQISEGSTVTVTTAHVCSTYTDATCTEAAKCTVCGKANGEALGHIDENPADGTCDRCGEDLTATKIPANLSFASVANKASADDYLTTNYPGWTITGKLGQTYGGYLGFGRSGDTASSIKSSEIRTETGFTITTILKGNGSNGVATSTLTFTLVDVQGNVVATGYADGSDVAKITPVDAKDTTYSIAFTFADGKGWADVSNLVITFAKSTGNISLKSLDFVVA